MLKKTKRRIATSDPDKSKGNSSLFKSILKNTRDAGSKSIAYHTLKLNVMISDINRFFFSLRAHSS